MTTYAATYTECAASVVDDLRLDSTADATRVSQWLNRRLVEVAVKTRYFSGSSAGSALAAAASSQALPAAIVELEYVTCAYGGQTTYLRPVEFDQLLMYRANGSGGSGPPQVYALRKDTLEFWPAAIGTEALTYYGATLPSTWSGSAVSGLPEPFGSELLIAGACIDAASFKNDPKLYLYYQQTYERQLASFQAYLNRRLTQTPRAFPVYGPDGRPFGLPYIPHDPSSDFWVTGFRS